MVDGLDHQGDVEYGLVVHEDEVAGLGWDDSPGDRDVGSADARDGCQDEPRHGANPATEGRNASVGSEPDPRRDDKSLDRIGGEEAEAQDGEGQVPSELRDRGLQRYGNQTTKYEDGGGRPTLTTLADHHQDDG